MRYRAFFLLIVMDSLEIQRPLIFHPLVRARPLNKPFGHTIWAADENSFCSRVKAYSVFLNCGHFNSWFLLDEVG